VIERLAQAGCRTWFVGTIDEEKGAEGALHLARSRRVAAEEAVVLEPTGLNLVHAHKGVVWFTVETDGVTAHGADPAAGVSAIDGMVEVMGWLRGQVTAGHEGMPLMERPTLNIGRIEGGSAVNIVPGRCLIEADLRIAPGAEPGRTEAMIREGLDRLQAEGLVKGYRFEVRKRCPAFHTPPDSPLALRLAAAARAERADPSILGTGWFSDAGPLAAVCREIVVFGPGSIGKAHTPDEYIEVEELVRGAAVLERFLEATVREMTGRDAA
jgi:acetylornithine deacetylase/succinyl-diaminopimelate desuccinylase-like protein